MLLKSINYKSFRLTEHFQHPPTEQCCLVTNATLFRFTLKLCIIFLFFCLICVVRSKRTDFGPHDWHSMPVSGAQTWLVVPGLEPGTEYQFSVLAQNKLGTGPFSEVVTVNTAGGYLIKCFPIHVCCFLTSEWTHRVVLFVTFRISSGMIWRIQPSHDL